MPGHPRSLTGHIKNLFYFEHFDWTKWADADESTIDKIVRGPKSEFAFGDEDNEVDLIYHDRRYTRGGAAVVFDLTDGTLIDEFGGALNFSHVKGLQVINLDLTNPLLVLGPTGAEMLTILVPAGVNVVDSLSVPPMGHISLVNPLAGWATAAGDEIEVDPGGNDIMFDICIVGIGTRTEDQPTTTSTVTTTATTTV